MTALKNLIHYLTRKPRILFLADSSGALLTAFFLFVVWGNFSEYVGLPQSTLHYLAAIAACFCIYSAACYFFLKGRWTPFIRAISIANLLYCVLTFGLLIWHSSSLTLIGIMYFLGEIAIVCGLVYIELSVAAALRERNAG